MEDREENGKMENVQKLKVENGKWKIIYIIIFLAVHFPFNFQFPIFNFQLNTGTGLFAQTNITPTNVILPANSTLNNDTVSLNNPPGGYAQIYILNSGAYSARNTSVIDANDITNYGTSDIFHFALGVGDLENVGNGSTFSVTGENESSPGFANVGWYIIDNYYETNSTPAYPYLLYIGNCDNFTSTGKTGGVGTIVYGSNVLAYGSIINLIGEGNATELAAGMIIYEGGMEVDSCGLNVEQTNLGFGLALTQNWLTSAGGVLMLSNSDVTVSSKNTTGTVLEATVGIQSFRSELSSTNLSVTADGNGAVGFSTTESFYSEGSYVTVMATNRAQAGIETTDFDNNGSWVTATATNGAQAGIEFESYYQYNGAILQLGAGDAPAMSGDYAVFYDGTTVIVDYDAQTGTIGQFVANSAVIDGSVNAAINVINPSFLQKGETIRLNFFDVGAVTGRFLADASLGNYDVEIVPNSNGGYDIVFTRSRMASDSLTGTNRSLALGLENGMPGRTDLPGYKGVNDLYTLLDNTTDSKTRDALARRSSGWQAGVFNRILMSNTDMRQNNLFNQLTQMRSDGMYNALTESVLLGQAAGTRVNPWTRWVSWDGNDERLGGETASYEDLRANSSAFNIGMARKAVGFGRRAYVGFNFSYNYGNFRDTSDSADRGSTKGRYDGFAALASARIDRQGRSYWTDWTLGWMVSTFDMDRRDYLGAIHQSDTTAGIFRLGWAIGQDYGFRTHKYYYYYEHCRLSPILGVDYSAISQAGLAESNNGNGLALSGKDDWMNSMRGKLGLEFAYKYTDLAFTMHSYLRYEFWDKGMELPMSFASAPAIRYDVLPQSIDRLSGIFGFNLTCQLFENQDVGFSYDGIFIDGGSSHWFNLRYVRRF